MTHFQSNDHSTCINHIKDAAKCIQRVALDCCCCELYKLVVPRIIIYARDAILQVLYYCAPLHYDSVATGRVWHQYDFLSELLMITGKLNYDGSKMLLTYIYDEGIYLHLGDRGLP